METDDESEQWYAACEADEKKVEQVHRESTPRLQCDYNVICGNVASHRYTPEEGCVEYLCWQCSIIKIKAVVTKQMEREELNHINSKLCKMKIQS